MNQPFLLIPFEASSGDTSKRSQELSLSENALMFDSAIE